MDLIVGVRYYSKSCLIHDFILTQVLGIELHL